MSAATADELRRRRLRAQCLTAGSAAASPAAAARAVLGIQAQDIRAAGLAIRARAPTATRDDLATAGLVRTWTVRGTAHLLAADDLPWLDSLTGPRNRRRCDALMRKRSNLATAEAIRPAALELLANGPLTRAELIERLDERGLPSLGPYSINVLMPWLASTGEIVGLADGSFRRADSPPGIDEEEALATLGRRYLAGYGPAGPEDLARWSGLPITACRRALASVAGAVKLDDGLVALPDEPGPPAPAPASMLGAFDTALLGWRDRTLLVDPAVERRLVPGGGIIRAAVLSSGRVAATWKLEGSGRRRRVSFDWFGPRPPEPALAAEIDAVGSWLGLELEPAS
ncbi:MAG TPA: winged helix DNA-binding domain-containing protein [Solirubrobacterales bacterium]|nr:winged helix DNA-binding domain-containing protein [Solirubrobacterales bacterium]